MIQSTLTSGQIGQITFLSAVSTFGVVMALRAYWASKDRARSQVVAEVGSVEFLCWLGPMWSPIARFVADRFLELGRAPYLIAVGPEWLVVSARGRTNSAFRELVGPRFATVVEPVGRRELRLRVTLPDSTRRRVRLYVGPQRDSALLALARFGYSTG